MVTRYEDVLRVVKDTATFSSRAPRNPFSWFGEPERQDELNAILRPCPEIPTLLDNDPPEQTKVRGLVAKVFNEANVAALEPDISDLIDNLSATWIDRGRVEFATEFARPLPAAVTALALGADPAMTDRCLFWADEIMTRTAGPQTPERQAEVATGIAEMSDYFFSLISERRAAPRNDLFSLLTTIELDGERLTDIQIVNVAKVFLVGGNETTMFMLTSALHRLATEPALAQTLRDAPALIEPFLEEILRLEAPAQGLPRFPTRDVGLHGVTIPAGSTVFVLYCSANHDDTVFDDADDLVLDRRARGGYKPHLAFSVGPHFCLGARLARTEGRLALARLLPRMTNLSLATDTEPQRAANPLLRGFVRLDLLFGNAHDNLSDCPALGQFG
ncbi:cytochrome P450 [Mycolicibacterium porcinum]|uniref:Cytochrome P450 n=1 Tax=Mycolicibacterium porcinum TaxID=39693 RepID=A0AAW5SY20_9MYCO|nr:cytochrome P450 [Mycolicibacterium porcinum]MCV7388070.1 cytochrome P450 [Mycolicibacterium porcinum]ORB43404.1 cytochrome P450 [Mycolicibacterium porcinum]